VICENEGINKVILNLPLFGDEGQHHTSPQADSAR